MAAEGEAIKVDPNIPILFARAAKIASEDEVAKRLPNAVDVFVQTQVGLLRTYNNTVDFRQHFLSWVGRVVATAGTVSSTAKPQYSKPGPSAKEWSPWENEAKPPSYVTEYYAKHGKP